MHVSFHGQPVMVETRAIVALFTRPILKGLLKVKGFRLV
jgi:hypothetical protein